MRRFFSHYTFIYPDTYLKNYVIELDSHNKIRDIFLFEKEIRNTEFYSGLVLFVPKDVLIDEDFICRVKERVQKVTTDIIYSDVEYVVYDESGLSI